MAMAARALVEIASELDLLDRRRADADLAHKLGTPYEAFIIAKYYLIIRFLSDY